jgi:hypothetical protein
MAPDETAAAKLLLPAAAAAGDPERTDDCRTAPRAAFPARRLEASVTDCFARSDNVKVSENEIFSIVCACVPACVTVLARVRGGAGGESEREEKDGWMEGG